MRNAKTPETIVEESSTWLVKDEDLPVVIGSDGAGEVCALGDGVHGWKVGDQVYALFGDDSQLLN